MLTTGELCLCFYSICRTKISKVGRLSKTNVSRSLIAIAVKEGDRIAQLIVEKIHTPDVLEVKVSIPPLWLVDFIYYRLSRTLMRLFAVQEGLGPQVATAPFESRASHFLVLAVVPPVKFALLSIATGNDAKDCIKMRVANGIHDD